MSFLNLVFELSGAASVDLAGTDWRVSVAGSGNPAALRLTTAAAQIRLSSPRKPESPQHNARM